MAAASSPGHARNLRRIIELVDKLFLMVNEQWIPLFLKEDTDDGSHISLHTTKRYDYTREPFDSRETSIEGQLAFLSYNYCRTAVRDFAGLIAYTVVELEIPLHIEEIYIGAVEPVRLVYLNVDYNFDWKPVAELHTMFKITRNSLTPEILIPVKGFYVDPTARQYYKKPRISDVTSFQQYYTETLSTTRKYGAEYRTHLRNFFNVLGIPKKMDRIDICRTEAKIRKLNNLLYEQLKEKGGLAILAESVEEDWVIREQSIMEAVKQGLAPLRDRIWQMQCVERPDKEFIEVAMREYDNGYHTMVQAIGQVSGTPFSDWLVEWAKRKQDEFGATRAA